MRFEQWWADCGFDSALSNNPANRAVISEIARMAWNAAFKRALSIQEPSADEVLAFLRKERALSEALSTGEKK